jgi:hypothetical protein
MASNTSMNPNTLALELELLQLRRQLADIEGKGFDVIEEVINQKISEAEAAILKEP